MCGKLNRLVPLCTTSFSVLDASGLPFFLDHVGRTIAQSVYMNLLGFLNSHTDAIEMFKCDGEQAL